MSVAIPACVVAIPACVVAVVALVAALAKPADNAELI